jgi:translocator protein
MKLVPLIFSIGIAQGAGVIGSFFTVSGVATWYTTIVTPEWNPPSWVFGPVWIGLYTLMGIAAFLVWQKRGLPGAKLALLVYGVHLVLNALWSVLFFGLHNPALAFAEILILLVFIVGTIILFWRIHTWAGALLLPYLAWVSFAAFLNYTIWQLN